MRKNIDHPVMDYLESFSQQWENGEEYKIVMKAIGNQDYADQYQKS
ncbi:MAG TPA: hypothetical protein H9740_05880 [Candidatus Hungatella pullicola]|nr:hypothetical protein [Candidatus Hungatella pullicola]